MIKQLMVRRFRLTKDGVDTDNLPLYRRSCRPALRPTPNSRAARKGRLPPTSNIRQVRVRDEFTAVAAAETDAIVRHHPVDVIAAVNYDQEQGRRLGQGYVQGGVCGSDGGKIVSGSCLTNILVYPIGRYYAVS
jgi:hypothetical protein